MICAFVASPRGLLLLSMVMSEVLWCCCMITAGYNLTLKSTCSVEHIAETPSADKVLMADGLGLSAPATDSSHVWWDVPDEHKHVTRGLVLPARASGSANGGKRAETATVQEGGANLLSMMRSVPEGDVPLSIEPGESIPPCAPPAARERLGRAPPRLPKGPTKLAMACSLVRHLPSEGPTPPARGSTPPRCHALQRC